MLPYIRSRGICPRSKVAMFSFALWPGAGDVLESAQIVFYYIGEAFSIVFRGSSSSIAAWRSDSKGCPRCLAF